MISPAQRRTLAATLWTLFILAVCWTPRAHMHLPEDESSFLRIPHLDKVVHSAMFLGFGLLWRRAGGALAQVATAGLILAVVTELGQGTALVGRDADMLDGLADLGGLTLGFVCHWRLIGNRSAASSSST